MPPSCPPLPQPSPNRPGAQAALHRKPWAIEIKRSRAPTLEAGFHVACESVRPERRFLVYGGEEQFPIAADVTAIPLIDLCSKLAGA